MKKNVVMSDISHIGYKSLQQLVLIPVRWSLRLGGDFSSFVQLVKRCFYLAAHEELQRRGRKPTGSAIHSLSGLHRVDVQTFRLAHEQGRLFDDLSARKQDKHLIGVVEQVVARWVFLQWPSVIALRNKEQSLQKLLDVIRVDKGVSISLNLVLNELVHRGIVRHDDEGVHLISEIGQASLDQPPTMQHFADSVSDHANACLHNLQDPPGKLLEQCMAVDGLHPESVEVLHALARVWWHKAVREIGAEALPLSERDEAAGGRQRLRLGVYFYTEPMDEEAVSELTSQHPHTNNSQPF